ncbi:aquaporin [Pseudoxanthomonas putridarboris]|uniref:Aquaporin n=1 Tax=Pseudoxanthomonas putridarboris TaxID=752605 RepID=A0ABU9J167_9GAMM
MPMRSRLLAEALGSAFLLAVVVGSGIMGERLSAGNIAIALLANALATGCALFALIQMFGPISGAHFNPAVSLAMVARGKLVARDAAGYITAQVAGAFAGVASAHAMFGLPAFSASTHARLGAPLAWSEFIATFGLLLVILLASRGRNHRRYPAPRRLQGATASQTRSTSRNGSAVYAKAPPLRPSVVIATGGRIVLKCYPARAAIFGGLIIALPSRSPMKV